MRIRMDTQAKSELETLLTVEGGSLTELLVEGIWRVVAERQKYSEKLRACSHQTRNQLEGAINFRIGTEEAAALESLVEAERCSATHLVVEGIGRVIENRRQDPQYKAGRAHILALQAEIDQLRANLHSPLSDGTEVSLP